MSLFYSNPQGGWAGFFPIPCESVDAVTRLNCFEISRILPPNFCAFSAAGVGAFFKCRLFLEHDFNFSLTYKRVQCQALNFGGFVVLFFVYYDFFSYIKRVQYGTVIKS